jgi:hypothetical protein
LINSWMQRPMQALPVFKSQTIQYPYIQSSGLFLHWWFWLS